MKSDHFAEGIEDNQKSRLERQTVTGREGAAGHVCETAPFHLDHAVARRAGSRINAEHPVAFCHRTAPPVAYA